MSRNWTKARARDKTLRTVARCWNCKHSGYTLAHNDFNCFVASDRGIGVDYDKVCDLYEKEQS